MNIKAPAMQFYIDDWLSDEKLSACSMEAQGLWIKLLCLMHKNDKKGYLQYNGKPPTIEQLARITGFPRGKLRKTLNELIEMGVPSVDENGILYSRRILRDERKKLLCSEAGKRGGGNPNLRLTYKGPVKGAGKGGIKGIAKQNSNPSSSSPFPFSGIEHKKENNISISSGISFHLPETADAPCQEILDAYNRHCRPAGMPEAMLTESRQNKLAVRWMEPVFRDRWREIFEQAGKTPFLAGNNARGWKADFGWLIENDENYVKVLEGKYLSKIETDEDRERKKFDGLTRKEYIAKTLNAAREPPANINLPDTAIEQTADPNSRRNPPQIQALYGEAADRRRFGGLSKKEFLTGATNNDRDRCQKVTGNDGGNVARLETNSEGVSSLGEILASLHDAGSGLGDR